MASVSPIPAGASTTESHRSRIRSMQADRFPPHITALHRLGVALTALTVLTAWASPAEAARRPVRGYAVKVTPDVSSVVIDDEFTLTIRVDGVYEDFVDPPLADFQVVERYSKERNVLKDGRSDQFREIAYRLRPQRIGTLTIGPAKLIVGGKPVAQSAPVTITVTNPPPPTSAAEARKLDAYAGQPTFLHAFTADGVYAVGEPFVLAWDLYYLPDVSVTPVNVHTKPTLGGLKARETILKPPQPQKVTIGGREYMKLPYSRQVVVANAPIEELVVDPLKINANFEARFSKARLRSNAYSIQITSLPRVGRPDWFRAGNVGRFAMTATWKYLKAEKGAEPTEKIPERLVADDFLVLDLELSGTGNLEAIKPPVLDGAQRFEVVSLSPKGNDVVSVDASGIKGERHWRFRLRPKIVGTYITPKVHFAFFDPDGGGYTVLTEKGRMVTVDQTMRPTMGGLTLQNENLNAARAEIGWPNVKLTYTIPVEPNIDASPQIAVSYGNNLTADRVGLELGAEIRWHFWRDGPWSAAMVPNPALLVVVPTARGNGEFGLRFGIPAISIGYQATSTISLMMGAQIPFWMTLGEDPQVWLPILADLGVEFQIHRTDDAIINLMVGTSLGPSICLNKCPGPTVEFGLRAFLGGAIVW